MTINVPLPHGPVGMRLDSGRVYITEDGMPVAWAAIEPPGVGTEVRMDQFGPRTYVVQVNGSPVLGWTPRPRSEPA